MATSQTKHRAPPVFNGEDGENYLDWKLDIELWQAFTDLEKKKQATALLLELKEGGNVKNVVRSLGKDKLIAEDGLNSVLEALDKIYKEDDSAYTYRAYAKFEKLVRPKEMSLQSYISEFEKLNALLKKYKIVLPEPVLAYRFLNSANLPPEKVDLALATVKNMTYADMTDAVKKLFSINLNTSEAGCSNDGEVNIKVEPADCFVSGLKLNRGALRGPYRGNYRGGRGSKRGRGYSTYSRGRGAYRGCFNCQSLDHFARDCPKQRTENQYYTAIEDERTNNNEWTNNNNGGGTEVAYIQLIESSPDVFSLVHETLACAIVDSGCVKTVVGSNWIECYKETLSDEQLEKISFESCNSSFRFGDGEVINSKGLICIPTRIGSNNVLIKANVVDIELPLLLSKSALQKAKAVLNFENNTLTIAGEVMNLRETKSGHYAIPLCNRKRIIITGHNSPRKPKLVLAVTQATLLGEDDDQIRKKARKLHRQFSHCTASQLKTLLKNAGFEKKEYDNMIEEVTDNCDVCQKYKKVKPRPVVGLPRSRYFNDIVSMDLKVISKDCMILHMIDMATRFSSAGIVPNKNSTTIINVIFSKWISLFGAPNKFMADNGGEFRNKEYVELCENFNIETQYSAAESPFMNGMVERHHATLAETVLKTKDDVGCSWVVALAWGLNAKNSLQMFGGYSAYQLTMGRNPPLPNVIDDKLPSLEATPCSKVIAENLTALHKAREEFTKCESSNKIRKALRSQVRTCNDDYYNQGDKVFYKRRKDGKWHGPAVVVGRDTHSYLVKLSYQYSVVHPRDMQLCRGINAESNTKISEVPTNNINSSSDGGNEDVNNTLIKEKIVPYLNRENDAVVITEETRGNNDPVTVPPETTRSNPNVVNNTRKTLPKVKSYVEYLPKDVQDVQEHQWKSAYIHSRAGKATGKYANSLNVQLEGDDDVTCVEWTELASEWREKELGNEPSVDNEGVNEVLITNSIKLHDQRVIDAKLAELQKFKDNNVYFEVPDDGQQTVSVKWVVTEKDGGIKCRLVARGFEEDTDHIRTDSPTCSRDTLRMLISLVAGKGWNIQHIDVQAAFLQGKKITRNVYIRPPFEAESDKLWKLNKCIYGLVDAPRMWFTELSDTLEGLGMKVCTYDESFLFWKQNGELQGIMATHVDDLLNGGCDDFKQKVMQQLKGKFKLSKEVESDFIYTGLEVRQNNNCIELSQNVYIDELQKISIDGERSRDNKQPVSKTEYKDLRSICGQMLWVCSQTRPDLAYHTCVASNSTSSATIGDLKQVNKAIDYMQKNHLTLKYPKLDLNDTSLVVFCDAAYANLRDGSSQGAYIVFLASKNGDCCAIAWQSKKIKRLVKSSLSGESWAMIEAIETAELMKAMLMEIVGGKEIPIICITDCKSLFNELHTSNTIEDKGLRVPIGGLRRKLKEEDFVVKWVKTDKQLADPLTKAGASSKQLREVLSQGKFPEYLLDDIFG